MSNANGWGSFEYPSKKKEALLLNNMKWRIHTEIFKESYPLQVDIVVREEPGGIEKLRLTTLIEDLV